MSAYQQRFEELLDALRTALQPGEQFTLGYSAEQSQFVRLNHAKVRQAGLVSQASVQLRLVSDGRQAEQQITLGRTPNSTASACTRRWRNCARPCRCCRSTRT